MAKQMRGFALMSLEKRREAAAKGGRAQGKKTNSGNFAHNPKRAAKAGSKGGKAKRANNKIS
jgi:general stress protein YciG